MGRVSHDRFDGHVVRKDLVVRVENRAALRADDLFVNVFFSGEPGIFVVLDHLQINQAKRKTAEEGDKDETNERATNPAVPLHLAAR